MRMNIAVIIPTLNEEKSIEKVLDDVPKDLEVFVIDGLSTDNTVQIAKSKGAEVIIEKKKGKAEAVKKALRKLKKYDGVVMLDGDYTYDPKDIPKFIQKLDKYDIVYGSRFSGQMLKGAMSFTHKLGNMMLTKAAQILYGKKITDLCTGFIGFSKKAVKKIKITATGFDLEANIFSEAVKRGLSICEIPINYRPTKSESKLSLGDGYVILKMLIKNKFS